MAATNRPQDIDEAALRRLTKRIYIGLPDPPGRKGLIKKLMTKVQNEIGRGELNSIVDMTEGYSSADLNSLTKEAVMEPVREIDPRQILSIKNDKDLRPVQIKDFHKACHAIRPSVSKKTILEYAMWHKAMG
jgi:SpoVK/Ycf46/Vps4 family AAA+-type ATPase